MHNAAAADGGAQTTPVPTQVADRSVQQGRPAIWALDT